MTAWAKSPGLSRRILGRTGYEVSILGVGGWLGLLDDSQARAAVRERAAVEAVRRAVDLGINYFDTAPSYGDAERNLGLGLRELSKEERKQVYVSTKVGTHPERRQRYDRDAVRWSLERSLGVLGRERIDLVFVHDPSTDAHVDGIMGPGGAVEALEELKEEGAVGAVGLGVRTHRFLRRAIESGRFDAILPSYDFNLIRSLLGPVIELAFAQGVGVVNGSPYNAGLLAGLDPAEANQRRRSPEADVQRARKIWRWCRERGIDVGALATQYSRRDERISTTLAGPRTAGEVEGNVRHATAALPEGIWEELDGLLQVLGPSPPGGEAW